MEDQKELADFIKGVHRSLRLRAAQVGFEAAWEEHKHDQLVLKKYADSMKALATQFWDKTNSKRGKCRIEWVANECISYFHGGGWEKGNLKELKIINRLSPSTLEIHSFGDTCLEGRVRLLDVGSCYNPFSKFPQFQVTPIDIAPAVEGVIECDFLRAGTAPHAHCHMGERPLRTLPEEWFDVVVFSLFLEYLPQGTERFSACQKGVALLKRGGLLVIVTPDSNHQSSNSRLMKEWKEALAHLGLVRMSLIKLEHVWCMSFRKCFSSLGGGLPPPLALSIPQDRSDSALPPPPPPSTTDKSDPDNNKCVAELFTTLANDVRLFD